MGKVRVPLDIDETLKQDFIDRLESSQMYRRSGMKVKLNTVIQELMHYLIFTNDFQLEVVLDRGRIEKQNYPSYVSYFEQAEEDGLFDGLDLKRGNPKKAEINHHLMKYSSFPEIKDEVREELETINQKMINDELYDEAYISYLKRHKVMLEKVGDDERLK